MLRTRDARCTGPRNVEGTTTSLAAIGTCKLTSEGKLQGWCWKLHLQGASDFWHMEMLRALRRKKNSGAVNRTHDVLVDWPNTCPLDHKGSDKKTLKNLSLLKLDRI